MAQLTSLEQFRIILEFAYGIADRGIPLSVVVAEPEGWPAEAPTGAMAQALERLSSDIAARTRSSDRVAILEGARFAALLVDCNRQGALIFADRLTMAAEVFTDLSGHMVNCGVATFGEGMSSAQDLLDAACAALERAHGEGAGPIELHDPRPA